MHVWLNRLKKGVLLMPLAGMAALSGWAQDGMSADEAMAVSAYVDSSYLFLIGGLIVMFMAAGFLCLEAGLVRS